MFIPEHLPLALEILLRGGGSVEDVVAHWLHVLFVSFWVGGLASLIVAHRVEEFYGVYVRVARFMVASLALTGATGLYMAFTEYGDPSSWFMFGTQIGRIGEKITAFIIIALLMGYTHHSIARKGKVEPRDALMAAIALVVSMGAMMLGASLTLGR
jgi:putative copper export protein